MSDEKDKELVDQTDKLAAELGKRAQQNEFTKPRKACNTAYDLFVATVHAVQKENKHVLLFDDATAPRFRERSLCECDCPEGHRCDKLDPMQLLLHAVHTSEARSGKYRPTSSNYQSQLARCFESCKNKQLNCGQTMLAVIGVVFHMVDDAFDSGRGKRKLALDIIDKAASMLEARYQEHVELVYDGNWIKAFKQEVHQGTREDVVDTVSQRWPFAAAAIVAGVLIAAGAVGLFLRARK